MGQVKSLLMDVEEFVNDFYTKEGELTESPQKIISLAKEKFGESFGGYAEDVIYGDEYMEGHPIYG